MLVVSESCKLKTLHETMRNHISYVCFFRLYWKKTGIILVSFEEFDVDANYLIVSFFIGYLVPMECLFRNQQNCRWKRKTAGFVARKPVAHRNHLHWCILWLSFNEFLMHNENLVLSIFLRTNCWINVAPTLCIQCLHWLFLSF